MHRCTINIDTHTGVFCTGRFFLHKGRANTVLSTDIVYRSESRYRHWVSSTVQCNMYRDTPVCRSAPILYPIFSCTSYPVAHIAD